jgi:MFS family permease
MVVGIYWGVFAAFVPVIKDHIGAGDALFGQLLLGTAIGLVSAMWLAPRVDRVLGASGMRIAALVLMGVFLLPALAFSPLTFGLSMILVGMSSGLLDVVMNARVSELEARHDKPLMNANHAMFSLAYAIGAIATGFAREAGAAPFPVFLGTGVVVLLLSTQMQVKLTEVEEQGAARGKYPVLPILLCGGLVLIAFMSEATVEAWSALHIERTLMGGAAEGALGPAMLGLAMTIGRFSGQAVSEWLSDYTVIVGASLLSAFGIIIAATAGTPVIAYVGFGIMGLGVSVVGPIGLAIVGRLVTPAFRTEAISRAAVMGFSGFFVAPLLMGYLSEWWGLRVAFACLAFLLLALLPLIFAVSKLKRP